MGGSTYLVLWAMSDTFKYTLYLMAKHVGRGLTGDIIMPAKWLLRQHSYYVLLLSNFVSTCLKFNKCWSSTFTLCAAFVPFSPVMMTSGLVCWSLESLRFNSGQPVVDHCWVPGFAYLQHAVLISFIRDQSNVVRGFKLWWRTQGVSSFPFQELFTFLVNCWGFPFGHLVYGLTFKNRSI